MAHAPVSVIIPSYNCGHFLEDALESVLAQTVAPAQIIVIDDGSVDDTKARMRPYLDWVQYRYQPNQGVSAARNHALEVASQEFIAFLDADDVWHPQKLELQFGVFRSYPDLGLLGARPFAWPVPQFPSLEGRDRGRVTPVSWSQLVVKNRLCTSSIIVRRAILDRAGRFDTEMQGPEDRDVWLRVTEIARTAILELPLCGLREVPGSVSKHAERCQAGMLRILHKLDQRQAWHGRWLLRRKAYSYVFHSSAYLFGALNRYPRAMGCSLRSFLWYPLPYRLTEVIKIGERPRRFFVNLLRWWSLKAPDLVVDMRHAVEPNAVQKLAVSRRSQGAHAWAIVST